MYQEEHTMQIYSLKVNHLKNPLGFFMPRTIFSWKVTEAKGSMQKWARIRIASDAEMTALVYDSGEDAEAESQGTRVNIALLPRTRYYWTVTVCTDADEAVTSQVQWFETARQDETWTAQWITCESTQTRHPIFHKNITPAAGKTVSRARLYICGLGLYEAFYNGQRIGGEYLTPYCNDYKEWVQYQTYDVTQELQQAGELAVHLGNGWYKGRFGYWSAGQESGFYGNEWKLIAELIMDYTDGTNETIGTDETWSVTRSNITFSNIYDGEWRDDTLEAAASEQAVLCEAPQGELTERISPPVKKQEVLRPIELIQTPAGEQVFDLGQEITGLFRLRVKEPAGTKIRIQTGEVLQEGNFYNANLRSARSEYYYTADGTEQIIEPHFTFYGYRYVKVDGVSRLTADDFEGIALYSEMDRTGYVQTSHEKVNQLISNVRWGMVDNFLDVPTDCPQRDERMGWTGDAQVFAPTAMYLYDTYAFYTKYLYDMKKEQKALGGKIPDVVPSCKVETSSGIWGDASCIIPWHMYVVYGDKCILEDQFGSMKAWVDYIGVIDGDNHGWRKAWHYGDWVALDNPKGGAEQTEGATDAAFIADVYYANSADIVARSAAVLGKTREAEQYSALAQHLYQEVRREYYSVTGRCCIKTQTALLMTLRFGLSDNVSLTKEQLTKLFEDNNWKLQTGFVGTPLLGNVLTDNGMAALAFRLLLNEEYPGWLYEVNLGATTVWERWNSLLKDGTISGISMNSMNHYAYGSILEWIFRHVAGINEVNTEAGSHHMELCPELCMELGSAHGSYDSPAGEYRCGWELADDQHVTVRLQVPFGCTADVKLPMAPDAVFLKGAAAGNPLFAAVTDGICYVGAGRYEVSYELTESLTFRECYTLDTPIEQILKNPDVTAKLSRAIPLNLLPNHYKSMSIRELSGNPHSDISEQELANIERLLAG